MGGAIRQGNGFTSLRRVCVYIYLRFAFFGFLRCVKFIYLSRQSNTGALYLVRWDRWCVREGRTRYTTMRRREDDGWCEETKTTTRASECCGDGGSGGKG